MTRLGAGDLDAYIPGSHQVCSSSLHYLSDIRHRQNFELTLELSFVMSSYPYVPLLPGNIRLLRIIPDDNELAPVQCHLFSYPLSQVGRSTHLYEALSYVWGDENITLPIYMGQHRLDVTENLHAALTYLRDRSLDRVIWVDAICINQENDEEKEIQIQLMASIYSGAYNVVVWLGQEADDSSQALEAIVRAGNSRELDFADNPTIQQAVIKLLQRKWFRRIWVLTVYLLFLDFPLRS